MILWFAGVSVVLVWWVFRSPALDYRLVMLGSVLPLSDTIFGGPRLLHTLALVAAVLVVVMLATRHRRLLRRQLIGLPIGMLMHLVLGGVWAVAEVFWWPAFGWSFDDAGIPALDRPFGLLVLFDVVGLAALMWSWRFFGMSDVAHRRKFLTTGQLPRDLVI